MRKDGRKEARKQSKARINLVHLVPEGGLEPPRLTAMASKTIVSAIPPPGQCVLRRQIGGSRFKQASVVFQFLAMERIGVFSAKWISRTSYRGLVVW